MRISHRPLVLLLLLSLYQCACAYPQPVCRYPTLCARAVAEDDAQWTGMCTLDSGEVECSEGLECVHERAYWLQHPERWPLEAGEHGRLCGHLLSELMFTPWPMPGAPMMCQDLVQAVVVGKLNEMVIEYVHFPEVSRYLVDEGTLVARDCCAQVGENEALSHEITRLLHLFNDGDAPVREGGLAKCLSNETLTPGVSPPYRGNEAAWYHWLFYGHRSYQQGLNARGITLVAATAVLTFGILTVAAFLT